MHRLLVLAVILIVPASAAQLSPETATLYVHTDLSMQTESPSSGTTSGGALTDSDTWTIAMKPPLADVAWLDPAGTVDFTLTMGGSVHVGEVDVSVDLHNGATLVAAGPAQHHSLRTGYTALTWSETPLVDRVDPAAGNLVMTVTADGQASSYYLDTDASWVVLPVVEPPQEGAAVENVTVDDARLARDLTFENATDRTDILTWSRGPSDAVLKLAVNVTAGVLNVTVQDANGTVAHEQTVSEPFAGATNLTGLTAGSWNVTLSMSGFQGSFSLLIEPAEGPDENPEPAGNETEEGPGEDSPLPSVLLLAAALVALATRRRP